MSSSAAHLEDDVADAAAEVDHDVRLLHLQLRDDRRHTVVRRLAVRLKDGNGWNWILLQNTLWRKDQVKSRHHKLGN